MNQAANILNNLAGPLSNMVTHMHQTKELNKTQRMRDAEHMALAGMIIVIAGGLIHEFIHTYPSIDVETKGVKVKARKGNEE